MGKAIFSVTYEIIPDKRDAYFKLMKKVKSEVEKITGQKYNVYEDSERPNLMSEVFYLDDKENIDKIKQLQDEDADSLMSQIDQYVVDQTQVAIRTFIETV